MRAIKDDLAPPLVDKVRWCGDGTSRSSPGYLAHFWVLGGDRENNLHAVGAQKSHPFKPGVSKLGWSVGVESNAMPHK